MPLPSPPMFGRKTVPGLLGTTRMSTPSWVEILRKANYPTDVVVIDFETYFDEKYSLKKMSTIEFIEDERYEELGVSVVRMSAEFPSFVPEAYFNPNVEIELADLKSRYGENLERCTVVAQNAAFDGTILVRKCGIIPPFVVDVLGLARHVNSRVKNDLKSLCKRYKLPAKGETMEFIRCSHRSRIRMQKKGPPIMVPAMTADQLKALGDYANNDALREWDLFKILLPMLSRPAFELRVMHHTLSLFFEPSLAVDFEFGEKLIVDMEQKIVDSAKDLGHTRKEISGTNSFVALLSQALAETEETVPMKQGKKGPIPALSKTDPERDALLKHPNENVRRLMEAKVAIKSWPLHIKRIKRIMEQAKAAGGLLPVSLKYMGAHTGRFSGGEKVNLQNLSSRSKEPLINSIRELITAPEGWELVIADASQIEARVLSWIAGQEDLCEKFRNGAEIYCELASKITGKTIRKARKSDIKQVAAYLKRMRDMGKVGILGGGYGLGWEKCMTFARDTYGVILTEAESRKLIKEYRESVPKIVKFWKDIEHAFKYTTKYGRPCSMPRGLRFTRDASTTVIHLPNFRVLRYEGATVSGSGRNEELWMPDPMRRGKRIHMWGGYLTENVVQAMSRDILAEAVIEVEYKHGHRVPLHVHDEIIAVVEAGNGERVLELVNTELSTPRAWCLDCPLGSEGHVSQRYGKAQ